MISPPTQSPISTISNQVPPSPNPASPLSTPCTVPSSHEDEQRPWLDRLNQRLFDPEGESKQAKLIGLHPLYGSYVRPVKVVKVVAIYGGKH